RERLIRRRWCMDDGGHRIWHGDRRTGVVDGYCPGEYEVTPAALFDRPIAEQFDIEAARAFVHDPAGAVDDHTVSGRLRRQLTRRPVYDDLDGGERVQRQQQHSVDVLEQTAHEFDGCIVAQR